MGQHGVPEGRVPVVDEPVPGSVVGPSGGNNLNCAGCVVDVVREVREARICPGHMHEGIKTLCRPRCYHVALRQTPGVQVSAVADKPLPHGRPLAKCWPTARLSSELMGPWCEMLLNGLGLV